MPTANSAITNYTNKMIMDLWDDIAPGYYNYGRIDPDTDIDKLTDLKQANEDMVQHIIKELGINKDSHILELGCGKGMYTVRIAEITGCRYTGVDLCKSYVENDCKKWAAEHGVSEQGEFIIGDMTDLPAQVRGRKYTHVLVLLAYVYVQNKLDIFLENVTDCCDKDTQVLLWGFNRLVDWSECQELEKHIKLGFPLLTRQEMVEGVHRSKLKLTGLEDNTQYVIPGYKVMERECRKRDPELKQLTFPLWGRGLMGGKIENIIYRLKLQ